MDNIKFTRNLVKRKIVPSVKIILLYNNEVLLLREGKSWDLPGGRMNYGESIFECLKRELQEELGVVIEFTTEPRLIRVYDYLHPQDKVQRVYIVYAYQLPEKIIVDSNFVEWMSIEKIKKLEQNEEWKKMILLSL